MNLMSGASSDAGFDRAHFRAVLGHFPTGVTIITGMVDTPDGRRPTGLTIGSFASISLDPPLVGFFPMLTSDSWRAIEPTGAFCVNVLRSDQAELCWRFAKGNDDDPLGINRFDGVSWSPAPSGAPVIDDVAAWIDCSIQDVITLGDHSLVVGAVTGLDHHTEIPEPLVFYRGAVGTYLAGR